MPTAAVLAERIAYHGEGAVWWPDGRLRMVDGYAGEVLDLAADGGTPGRVDVGGYAAALRPRVGGGAVLGVGSGFALLDPDGTRHAGPQVLGGSQRMNDGACDPDGNFWCGSTGWQHAPDQAELFRLTDDGAAAAMLHGASVSNGLDWSPDGGLAYWNDTPTQTVWCFDYAWDVGLVNRRPFVVIDAADGAPDGLTVDRTGAVWVAIWGGRAVRRYDADGRLDLVVEVEARQVTSCAIGGADLDRLFITTSRENLADDDDPLAGSVFAFDLGDSLGAPVRPYGG